MKRIATIIATAAIAVGATAPTAEAVRDASCRPVVTAACAPHFIAYYNQCRRYGGDVAHCKRYALGRLGLPGGGMAWR